MSPNRIYAKWLFILAGVLLVLLACNLPGGNSEITVIPAQPPISPAESDLAEEEVSPNFSPTDTPVVSIVDQILARCPSPEEVAEINTRVEVIFDSDPSGPALVCTAEGGSVDLTLLQKNTYAALLVMRAINFTQPLPWTDLQLFDWFTQAVRGVRFTDTEGSYCCDEEERIVLSTNPNMAVLQTDKWIPSELGVGVDGLMILMVHEARHNEGFPHTCESWDETIDELGSWGVQYYLMWWMVFHSPPDFFNATEAYPDYYRDIYISETTYMLEHNFCDEPAATPGPTPTWRP